MNGVPLQTPESNPSPTNSTPRPSSCLRSWSTSSTRTTTDANGRGSCFPPVYSLWDERERHVRRLVLDPAFGRARVALEEVERVREVCVGLGEIADPHADEVDALDADHTSNLR